MNHRAAKKTDTKVVQDVCKRLVNMKCKSLQRLSVHCMNIDYDTQTCELQAVRWRETFYYLKCLIHKTAGNNISVTIQSLTVKEKF